MKYLSGEHEGKGEGGHEGKGEGEGEHEGKEGEGEHEGKGEGEHEGKGEGEHEGKGEGEQEGLFLSPPLSPLLNGMVRSLSRPCWMGSSLPHPPCWANGFQILIINK